MRTALSKLRRLLPFLVGGVVITLFVAWGLPIMLASRGAGAMGAPTLQWLGEPSEIKNDEQGFGLNIAHTAASMPAMQVHRGILADRYVALRSEIGSSWPVGELMEMRLEHEIEMVKRIPPAYVVVSPPAGDEARYARIDTALVGWPFRAFRSEAWYLADDNGMGHEAMPELHGNWNLGLVDGQLMLVPHQPLWLGIAGNLVFWSSLSWAVVAFPLAIRRRRREKYGKCVKCGYAIDPHAVKRIEVCPECGASFRRDPLGFAHSPEMHFQNAYVWIIFISSLDIMLTWKILIRGGIEVNPVAAVVIDAWGMHGAIAFKFALMMWVIVACEILARLKRNAGRFLAGAAIVISASPVVWSLFLLVVHEFFPE
ncbi:MAG: hypothetical protein RLY21_1694 [Planctomycetota bacterium]|jgi:hypothetical protein